MLICAESRTQGGGQTDDRHTDHSQQEAAGVGREMLSILEKWFLIRNGWVWINL